MIAHNADGRECEARTFTDFRLEANGLRVGDRVAVRVGKRLRKPNTTLAMFETAGGVGNRMEGQ